MLDPYHLPWQVGMEISGDCIPPELNNKIYNALQNLIYDYKRTSNTWLPFIQVSIKITVLDRRARPGDE